MRILFDTNVILDVFLDRQPFSQHASELLSRAERGQIIGFACATTITTIHYLCRKALGKEAARNKMTTLLSILDVAAVNKSVIMAALNSRVSDFEDAVLTEAAVLTAVEAIASRNKKDFSAASVAVYSPGELLNLLDANG